MAQTKTRIDPEVLDELLRKVSDERDLTGVLRQLSKQLYPITSRRSRFSLLQGLAAYSFRTALKLGGSSPRVKL